MSLIIEPQSIRSRSKLTCLSVQLQTAEHASRKACSSPVDLCAARTGLHFSFPFSSYMWKVPATFLTASGQKAVKWLGAQASVLLQSKCQTARNTLSCSLSMTVPRSAGENSEHHFTAVILKQSHYNHSASAKLPVGVRRSQQTNVFQRKLSSQRTTFDLTVERLKSEPQVWGKVFWNNYLAKFTDYSQKTAGTVWLINLQGKATGSFPPGCCDAAESAGVWSDKLRLSAAVWWHHPHLFS